MFHRTDSLEKPFIITLIIVVVLLSGVQIAATVDKIQNPAESSAPCQELEQ